MPRIKTIRRFNPQQGLESGGDFVLPVNNPDAEHAAASKMSNAVSFTTKTENSEPLPIAFCCVGIEERE